MMQTLLAGALAMGLSLLGATTPGAAGSTEALLDSGTVTVEEATASPAKRGETIYIHFRIVNDSEEDLHLAALRASVAPQSRLMGRISVHQARDIGSISIGSEETLDLTGAQLWYEAYPLDRDLAPGETFEVVLDFVSWRLSVPVRVVDHGAVPDVADDDGER